MYAGTRSIFKNNLGSMKSCCKQLNIRNRVAIRYGAAVEGHNSQHNVTMCKGDAQRLEEDQMMPSCRMRSNSCRAALSLSSDKYVRELR